MKRSILVGLVLALLIAGSVSASGGLMDFTSVAPDATSTTVTVTFTVEDNHAYYLSVLDTESVQVCRSSLSRQDAAARVGLETKLSCTATAGGTHIPAPPYTATFQVEHHTNLIPVFVWS